MFERYEKPAFSIIGKEGSTDEGEGFIQRLFAEANRDFAQIQPLAKMDKSGRLPGVWGAMSDKGRSFQPWENFSEGLYLVGVEVEDDAIPPEGWVKWNMPGFVYIKVEGSTEGLDNFHRGLKYLEERGLTLAGAVQEFNDLRTGQSCTLFPIERL